VPSAFRALFEQRPLDRAGAGPRIRVYTRGMPSSQGPETTHSPRDASRRFLVWCDAKLAIRERLCHAAAVGMPLPLVELRCAQRAEPDQAAHGDDPVTR
jgi:hypothetical protein